MAELKDGQQIIFKHPGDDQIRVGVYEQYADSVTYFVTFAGSDEVSVGDTPAVLIKEWCDAEAAWNALTLQEVRTGSFEWNEGPTVEP